MGKSATDLEKNPIILDSGGPQPPVNKLIKSLMIVGGKKLELLTRTNKAIVSAINCGGIYRYRFHSGYISDRIEQLERISVAVDGKGRDELIRAVQAGGAMPDSYYEGAGGRAPDYAINDE